MPFKLHAPFSPAGDQPDAIHQLTEGILHGEKYQTFYSHLRKVKEGVVSKTNLGFFISFF